MTDLLPRWVSPLLETLRRMSTAVFLLGALALASIAGTLLLQNQPYEDYQTRFGPFWFEVFRLMGLYHVYGSSWFVACVAVLTASVACCLALNGPRLWQQLARSPKLPLLGALRSWPVQRQYPVADRLGVETALAAQGFSRLREVTDAGTTYVYWRRGAANRLGYFLTHGGVVVLCVAGVFTGFLGFRGHLNLPNGESFNAVWVQDGSGYDKVMLPFTVRNDGFSVEFYDSGMPKAFVTDLTLLENGREVLSQRLEVNEPVFYKDHAIYQASFADAGTKLTFRVRDMAAPGTLSSPQHGEVYQTTRDEARSYSLEFVDFRLHNVERLTTAGPGKTPAFKSVGPSVDYIVRGPDIAPVMLRSYLSHPDMLGLGDGEGGYTPYPLGLSVADDKHWPLVGELWQARKRHPGPDGLTAALKEIAPRHAATLSEEELLRASLGAMQAVELMETVGVPFVLSFDEFDHKEYTGLQIARDPGLYLFWLGSLMLVLGAYLMTMATFVRVWMVVDGECVWVAAMPSRPTVALDLPPEVIRAVA
jgi:cytochrome c biogenesis protein